MPEIPDPQPPPETTHPYGVRFHLKLGSNVELVDLDDQAALPFAKFLVLSVSRERTPAHEEARFIKRIAVGLDAFTSAGEAERAGNLLALSLLWAAAAKRISIEFRKRTGPFPFAIRNRTIGLGLSVEAEGRAFTNVTMQELAGLAEEAYQLDRQVPPTFLTSMEFFAAARMESSERGRFIGLMTALEALSNQLDYGDEIGALLSSIANQLNASPTLQSDQYAGIRNSLVQRVKHLRRESVRHAILRVLRTHAGDRETLRFFEEAYSLRSEILHEGYRPQELSSTIHKLESVIRRVYSSMLDLPLPS